MSTALGDTINLLVTVLKHSVAYSTVTRRHVLVFTMSQSPVNSVLYPLLPFGFPLCLLDLTIYHQRFYPVHQLDGCITHVIFRIRNACNNIIALAILYEICSSLASRDALEPQEIILAIQRSTSNI